LSLDPRSVAAQTGLAGSLAGRVLIGLSDSRAADLARADELIDKALAASPRSPSPHRVKGEVLRAQNRCDEAIPEYETALASNPNFVAALNGLGWCKLFAGSIDEVIPLVEQALRRSPRDPGISAWHFLIGTVHLLQSRTDQAIVWLEKHETTLLPNRSFTSTSPPPLLSAATWAAPPASSPKPEGYGVTVLFRASRR
jgi:Tfp pilus assembly protein PilF